jgi:hypothetical protein
MNLIYNKKFILLSVFIWICVLVDSFGGIFGIWSIEGPERNFILVVKSILLLILLANSVLIKKWVLRTSTDKFHHTIARLSVMSLLFCLCGDIVNFNLPQTFYRHGDIIKHDYLADSVLFFAPGYVLLLMLVVLIALKQGLKLWVLFGLLLASTVGLMSFFSIHIRHSGDYISILTGGYAPLITAVGLSSALWILSLNKVRRSVSIGMWLVALGLMLAAVADVLIGHFWLYGNKGLGFYPLIRDLNWIVYIASQCLVIHLPAVLVLSNQKNTTSN